MNNQASGRARIGQGPGGEADRAGPGKDVVRLSGLHHRQSAIRRGNCDLTVIRPGTAQPTDRPNLQVTRFLNENAPGGRGPCGDEIHAGRDRRATYTDTVPRIQLQVRGAHQRGCRSVGIRNGVSRNDLDRLAGIGDVPKGDVPAGIRAKQDGIYSGPPGDDIRGNEILAGHICSDVAARGVQVGKGHGLRIAEDSNIPRGIGRDGNAIGALTVQVDASGAGAGGKRGGIHFKACIGTSGADAARGIRSAERDGCSRDIRRGAGVAVGDVGGTCGEGRVLISGAVAVIDCVVCDEPGHRDGAADNRDVVSKGGGIHVHRAGAVRGPPDGDTAESILQAGNVGRVEIKGSRRGGPDTDVAAGTQGLNRQRIRPFDRIHCPDRDIARGAEQYRGVAGLGSGYGHRGIFSDRDTRVLGRISGLIQYSRGDRAERGTGIVKLDHRAAVHLRHKAGGAGHGQGSVVRNLASGGHAERGGDGRGPQDDRIGVRQRYVRAGHQYGAGKVVRRQVQDHVLSGGRDCGGTLNVQGAAVGNGASRGHIQVSTHGACAEYQAICILQRHILSASDHHRAEIIRVRIEGNVVGGRTGIEGRGAAHRDRSGIRYHSGSGERAVSRGAQAYQAHGARTGELNRAAIGRQARHGHCRVCLSEIDAASAVAC